MAGTLRLQSGSSPSTPPAGYIHFYSKADKLLYYKDDTGTEYLIAGPADTDAVPEGAINLYFTDERAQDAVGTILISGSKVTLTYNDGAPSMTADIVAGSLANVDISASAAIAYSKLNLSNSIVNADVNTSAAIDRTKLASGTADHVVINNGSGVMSSEANLAITRGGTGSGTSQGAINALSQLTTAGDLLHYNGTNSTRLPAGTNDYVLLADSGQTSGLRYAPIYGAVGVTVDGAGSALTTGLKGYVTCPFNGTITGWDIVADQSGSVVIDVWKANNAVPTVGNTITASAKPTLTADQQEQSSTLTGWTTSVSAGDVFAFNIDSVSTMTRLTLNLRIRKK